jgi:hypothetical protein
MDFGSTIPTVVKKPWKETQQFSVFEPEAVLFFNRKRYKDNNVQYSTVLHSYTYFLEALTSKMTPWSLNNFFSELSRTAKCCQQLAATVLVWLTFKICGISITALFTTSKIDKNQVFD